MLFGVFAGWVFLLVWVVGSRCELRTARRYPKAWSVGVQEKVVVLVDIAFAVTTVVLVVLGVQELLK